MLIIAVQKLSGSYWKNWELEVKKAGHRSMLLDLRSEKGYETALTCDGIMWHIDMKHAIGGFINPYLS